MAQLPPQTFQFSSVQFSRSVVSDSLRPHESQHARPPCFSPKPEFPQTHVHQVGDAIHPSHPLSSLLLLLPIPPSIRVFSNESTLRMRWPKYWSFSFSISSSKENPGLISFRMDCLDLLAVLWTTRRSSQSIQKEINSEYSLGGLMLKLKLQYFGHLMRRTDSLEKTLMLGGIGGKRRRG